MQNSELADRIARLDWSGTSLQHQLAVSAAVGALRGMSAPVEVADNVVHLKDFFERPENTVGSISVDNLLVGSKVSLLEHGAHVMAKHKLTATQKQMLRDLADGDPTDYADFADKAGSALGWLNRDRVMKALERKGMIDDDNKLTDAGRAAMECAT